MVIIQIVFGRINWIPESAEYKSIVAKISKSIIKSHIENPREFTDETRKKISDANIKWMQDNPELQEARIKKMTETKMRQREDGTLSARHYTKTRSEEEITDIYNRIGEKSSVTMKELYASGQIHVWNEGLTKEMDDRLANIGRLNSIRLSGSVSPKRKYPMNSEEWIIICEMCDDCVSYESRGGYANAIRRIEGGEIFKCRSCSQIGRVVSEETRLLQSESAKNKNISPEVEEERRNKISERGKDRYANMAPQDRDALHQKQRIAIDNLPAEKKENWYRKVSESNIARIIDNYGTLNIFKPGYNRHTIPYIIDILNVRYDTEFIHACSEAGEFFVYDADCRKLYYADAYSKELNLWVEFDEPNKFRTGKLLDAHLFREERIRQCLPGVRIDRIYFDRRIHSNNLIN